MSERVRLQKFFQEEVDLYNMHTRHKDDEDDALKAVCHAIMWACCLDEHHSKRSGATYQLFRDSDPDGEQLNGVRYARNRALHQFAEVVKIVGGATLPAPFPAPLFEITWKLVTELPPPDPGFPNYNLRIFYEKHLQDMPVRFTFDALTTFFGKVP
jgi:hypothetical protein